MIEPILSKLQHQLFESVLNNLQSMFAGQAYGATGGGPLLQARPSEFDSLIREAAEQNNVDPSLLKAVVHAESNFSATAVSHAGAKGLMQLMDTTAHHQGVSNAFDPMQNLEGGAKFLRQLLDRYNGNEIMALAAYNAGPGAVDKWGGIPPYQETQTYVPRILNLRDQYREWSA